MMRTIVRRWPWTIGVALVLVCLLLAANSRQVRAWWFLRQHPDIARMLKGRPLSDIDELAELTSLTYPSGTVLLRSRVRFGLEDSLQALLQLQVEGPQQFIYALPSAAEVRRDDKLGIPLEGASWWHPETADRFIAVRLRRASLAHRQGTESGYVHEELHALLDVDEPRRPLLYVDWSAD